MPDSPNPLKAMAARPHGLATAKRVGSTDEEMERLRDEGLVSRHTLVNRKDGSSVTTWQITAEGRRRA